MQRKIRKIETINEFHKIRGLSSPAHPLVSLIDYSLTKISPEHLGESWHFSFYSIGIKRNVGTVRYGQQKYDFDEGLMSFIAPGQLLSIESNSRANLKPSGWLLLIHPDFIWNTTLAKSINQYDFFGYSINEALFLSKNEERIIKGVMQNIKGEIENNIDTFTQNIVISQVELLLNYSERFYQRQFITRKKINHEILTQLEILLNNYFDGENLIENGLPSVHYFAKALNLTPNYLSQLIKTLSGRNIQQHIHERLITKAKEKLSTTNSPVNEIAYQLGFEHSQSFSKLFKSKTKLSPMEFRKSFNN